MSVETVLLNGVLQEKLHDPEFWQALGQPDWDRGSACLRLMCTIGADRVMAERSSRCGS
jgi:hypothetical protein